MLVEIFKNIHSSINSLASPNLLIDIIIPIVASIGTITAAIFAAIAANAAKRSAIASEKSIKNNIMTTILGERYSDETYERRLKLRKYYEDNKNVKNMMTAFERKRNKRKEFDIDKYRRSYSQYFRKLFDLRLFSFVSDNEMINYVNWSDLNMLIEIVLPLEVVAYNTIPNQKQVPLDKFKNEVFDYFKILYDFLNEKKSFSEKKEIKLNEIKLKELDNGLENKFKRYWKNRKTYIDLRKYV